MTDLSKTDGKRSAIRGLFKPKFAKEWLGLWKERGFKGFVKEKGWKVVAAFILFYLLRDSLLYLALPYFAAKGIFGC